MELWQLKQRQSLPMAAKVRLSEDRIRKWYDYWKGDVYVAFSGGKDSTVLLHLVRSLYPEVPAVFADTGLEFPEIREFVKSHSNVHWAKPKKTFKQVLEEYGYPVVSKEVSQKIHEVRTTKSDKLRHKRLWGDDNKYKSGKIPEKWKRLIDAPFKISHRCCDYLKKNVSKQYEKLTNRKPFLGNMACDSHLRLQGYIRNGCNAFEAKRPMSSPLSFWSSDDAWEYLKQFKVPYCSIYDMGYDRTGCTFCMFGIHREKSPNKMQRLAQTHPALHSYCLNNLGLKEVLEFMDIPYE